MQQPSAERPKSTPTLGKYRLLAELGHGGMAEVFLAVVSGPGGFSKLVVIKQIRAELANEPDFLTMFLDEARLAARLSHPNVVQTNEVGHDNQRYFIAMEYLDGQPLNRVTHRLSGQGGLPLALYVRVLIDTLAGLHYAHELANFDGSPLGVVHRDVTPHNVFVTYNGIVKVVDFGIAKAFDSSSETRAGVLKGKVAYMAPEQARGERVDRRADIFSVGVMLWEAVVGRRLWKGMSEVAILHKLFSHDIPRPSSQNPAAPPELEAIIMRAIAPNREHRYATAADLQEALEGWLHATGQNITPRDLAKVLNEAFAEDRRRTQATIDSQLREAQSRSTAEWPAVRLPVIETSPSHSGASGIQQEPSSSAHSAQSASSLPSMSAPSGLLGSQSISLAGAVSHPTLSQIQAAPKSRAGLVVAAIVGAALVGGSAFFITKSGALSAAAAPTAAPSSAPAAPPASVSLKILATPAEAQLFLDDRPLATGPYQGQLPKDDAAHTLRIEAPGYEPETRSVQLDRDASIEVVLQKSAAPVASATAEATAAPSAPPTYERVKPASVATKRGTPSEPSDLKVGKPLQRSIDDKNPYAQ